MITFITIYTFDVFILDICICIFILIFILILILNFDILNVGFRLLSITVIDLIIFNSLMYFIIWQMFLEVIDVLVVQLVVIYRCWMICCLEGQRYWLFGCIRLGVIVCLTEFLIFEVNYMFFYPIYSHFLIYHFLHFHCLKNLI